MREVNECDRNEQEKEVHKKREAVMETEAGGKI